MSRLKEVMEPGGKKEKAKSFRLTAKANRKYYKRSQWRWIYTERK